MTGRSMRTALAAALLLGGVSMVMAQGTGGGTGGSGSSSGAASPGTGAASGGGGSGAGGGRSGMGAEPRSGGGARSPGGGGASGDMRGDGAAMRGAREGSRTSDEGGPRRAERMGGERRDGERVDVRAGRGGDGYRRRPAGTDIRVDLRGGDRGIYRRGVYNRRVVVRDRYYGPRRRGVTRVIVRGPRACNVRITRVRTAYGWRTRKVRICRR